MPLGGIIKTMFYSAGPLSGASLSYLMTLNPSFYLSLATLVVGILGGVYLFVDWLRHRRYDFSLFWSLSLFLHYWFQMPTILANLGIRFTLTDYNLFYLVAFPVVFLALILLYIGVLSIFHAVQRKTYLLLALWFFLSVIIPTVYFGRDIQVASYLPTLATLFLFIFPIQILILVMLWKWFQGKDHLHSRASKIGVSVMIAAMFMAVIQSFLALRAILIYPPQFWFIAITEANVLFVLQSINTLLLLAGFLLAHKQCCNILNKGGYVFNNGK